MPITSDYKNIIIASVMDLIFLSDNRIIMSESKLPSKRVVKLNFLRRASCFQMLTSDSIRSDSHFQKNGG